METRHKKRMARQVGDTHHRARRVYERPEHVEASSPEDQARNTRAVRTEPQTSSTNDPTKDNAPATAAQEEGDDDARK